VADVGVVVGVFVWLGDAVPDGVGVRASIVRVQVAVTAGLGDRGGMEMLFLHAMDNVRIRQAARRMGLRSKGLSPFPKNGGGGERFIP
jgi:hypothetical protein